VGLIAENGAPTIVTLTWQKRITTAYGGETTKIDFLANHPFEPFYDFFPHAEEHKQNILVRQEGMGKVLGEV